MNVKAYKEYMNDNSISPKQMANAAGIDESTWYRKMQREGESFTIKEMNAMIAAFDIPLNIATIIFFNEELA